MEPVTGRCCGNIKCYVQRYRRVRHQKYVVFYVKETQSPRAEAVYPSFEYEQTITDITLVSVTDTMEANLHC